MDKGNDSALNILSRIVEVSNSNIEVENRLKFICDILSKKLLIECVCIYKLPPQSIYLEPWVSSCMTVDECVTQKFKVKFGEGVAGMAAWKRQPFFVEDVNDIPPGIALVPFEVRDFTSIYSIPIKDDVYLYGAMNFSSTDKRLFTEREKEILRIVSVEVAGTIRNSRLYRDARKRVSELLTLNEISRAITSSFKLNDIVKYVARTTLRSVGAHGCTIRLYDQKRKRWEFHVSEGFREKGFDNEPVALGRKISTAILKEKRPLLINSLEDSHFYTELRGKGVHSFLGVPILSKELSQGVINYYSFSDMEQFDLECLNLVQTVATLLSNVVENVKVYREADDLAKENQAKVRTLQTLYNVARALMSTIKTDRLLRIMLEFLTSPAGFNYSRAVLFDISKEEDFVVPRMAFGPTSKKESLEMRKLYRRATKFKSAYKGLEKLRQRFWENVSGHTIPLSGNEGCIVASAVIEGKPVNCAGGCGKVLTEPQSFCSHHPDSFVVVPFFVKGKVKGAIYVDNAFTDIALGEEDVHLLTMFASEAGLALENSELYENLEKALTDLHKAQDRLIQSEKLVALGEMAAQLAHEIKNPLTVIGGFASRLLKKIHEGKRDEKDEPLVNYAWVIIKEVKRLERIINQTLYFSREKEPSFKLVNMDKLVNEVLTLFREEFEEKSISVEISLDPDLQELNADSDQIRQMFWNIISNAEQAMEGGGTLTVEIREVYSPFEGVEISISDTGGGIPDEILGNIFNPFFTTRARGTGLGLSIVHTIVSRHGGLINLDNRVGHGVTFQITLPNNPAERVKEKERVQLIRGGIDGFKSQDDQGKS